MTVFYQFFIYLVSLVFINSFLIKNNLLIDSPLIDKHKKKNFLFSKSSKIFGINNFFIRCFKSKL